MKNFLNLLSFLTICLVTVSCSTNYYTVLLSEDSKIYNSADSSNIITTIPKDAKIYLSSTTNKKNYNKIKWGNYSGWIYKPKYTSYNNYTPITTFKSSSSNYESSNSGGSVRVKGYYRKNGTYVRPHTRSSSSRRR